MTKHHKSLMKKLLRTFGLIGPASGMYPFDKIAKVFKVILAESGTVCCPKDRTIILRFPQKGKRKLKDFSEKHSSITPEYQPMTALTRPRDGRSFQVLSRQNRDLNLKFPVPFVGRGVLEELVVYSSLALELFGLISARSRGRGAKSHQETALYPLGLYDSEYHVRSCCPFWISPVRRFSPLNHESWRQ